MSTPPVKPGKPCCELRSGAQRLASVTLYVLPIIVLCVLALVIANLDRVHA